MEILINDTIKKQEKKIEICADTLLYLTPQLPGVPVGFVRSSFKYVFDAPLPIV